MNKTTHLRPERIDRANKKIARAKKLDIVFTKPESLAPEDRKDRPGQFSEQASIDLARAMGLL